jgi:hypothetical protein
VAPQQLSPAELRVLGCLIEKQRTTPEQYPLSLNSLRLACNQTTNRDPVVDYDESEVRTAVQHLGSYGWTRLATGPGSRTAKYRQLFQDALDLLPAEVSVLAVLMLRGPQTVSELKTRTERLHHFEDNAAVEATLERLAGKELTELLPKRPGQREERWSHLLANGAAPASSATGASVDSTQSPVGGSSAPDDRPQAPSTTGPSALEQRLARVETKLAELERALEQSGFLPE